MFYVIGIDDNREQFFAPEIAGIIRTHRVFSGGARHLEIMEPYLPLNYKWIPITVPLSEVMEEYRLYDDVVVFASGDPLFFGFANTLLRDMPDKEVRVYPYFNSLQLLAHRLQLPYQDMHIVSLTGRPWDKFDEALILGYEKIGILTDRSVHTPETIAERMIKYGYDNYTMCVGELLGNKEGERYGTYDLHTVLDKEFAYPNNIILQQTYHRERKLGLPEGDFHLLNGRVKMITKMPIRLLSLAMLNLREAKTFWDIGFCTGSVSIEAKLQFPHLKVISFECREEGNDLMEMNARKFGTPGITAVYGDFADLDVSAYPSPDAVFIGGHGGRMLEIVQRVSHLMPSGAPIVFNSVSDESHQLFADAVSACGLKVCQETHLQVDDHNPIDVMMAIKP
ncbi:precorrin-6y C5,15-methyltransferase (decarboxylating) subunit CbiE [Porphyromonas sp.]|uniref:precorrin-6y C5,15-methyltransferase (decarboxylating) subunit CbiE n=1 Tax=Porphyromonas sp. TaxID=1924944 RepID=UPI0026DCF776|nr:precorrin-6y C5,15-methyltransferase (decarboxylating) subunit CbiE [Porphyromonas sp.]MDO4695730.1 precorrin-6y C5,15-methyltransferase (decarboxylating) subunit CbiE [Porphyromonas sp.]MDO4771808.1 precorrin-6y C5,15-methyltransferase (decarboxylating) subunit CbiE [Porphyromonas sp.]